LRLAVDSEYRGGLAPPRSDEDEQLEKRVAGAELVLIDGT
jgi:hypothetical protein